MTMRVAGGVHRDGDPAPRAVLVLEEPSGQGRSAVAAVRALARAGLHPVVGVSDQRGPASGSRHRAGLADLPHRSHPQWVQAVVELLDTGRYLGALPTSDAIVRALDLDAQGFLDKQALAARAAAAGFEPLPGQVHRSAADLRRVSADLDYPVVVKPLPTADRMAHEPVVRLDGPADAAQLLGTGPLLVQPYLQLPMSAVGGVMWAGDLVAAVHQRYVRTWPIDCGTASRAVSTEPRPDVEARLITLLQGFEGIFQAQFLGPHLIDLNPRVYGSLPLAVASGVNLPAVLCQLVRGVDVPHRRGRAGVHYRWVEGDVRHLGRAVRRGDMPVREAVAAMRPRQGTAHSVGSLSDPGPLLRHASDVVRRRLR